MRRSRMLAVVALALSAIAPPAASAVPPIGAISSNVTFVANLPETRTAISINFIGSTMFVSTVTGIYSYDVSNPAAPLPLGVLPMYIWENEDVDVDPQRHLLFVSRDPRGFTTPATQGNFPYGMVHIIDVSDPRIMRELTNVLLGVGHTASCVNKCETLWVGGPTRAINQPTAWGGRPIFPIDIRKADEPMVCPGQIDAARNDGKTDYVHDVQVDPAGIAWVSGRGGVRGYRTSGRHRNPVTGKIEKAEGCKPIPYAGGGSDDDNTPSRFMHNAWRNPKASVDGRRGDVLYATEENISTVCESAGRFAIYDLRGSYNGEGWRNIEKTKFRMKVLSTWTVENQPGSTGCASAHYFTDRGDGIVAIAFYEQGTRFLDVSNPRRPRQVGYYRPDLGRAWAAYWHKGHVFVADYDRGVDVLKFTGGPGRAATVVAPPLAPRPAALDFRPSPVWGNLCRVPDQP